MGIVHCILLIPTPSTIPGCIVLINYIYDWIITWDVALQI